MGFQSVINDYQAPAVKGDFASMNPFASVLAGPGGLVAPAGGLIVGNFAWVGPNGQVSQSFVAGWQIGVLGRNMQALITEFLAEGTMIVPEGFMVTLFNEGDYWTDFPGGATVGGYVFADPSDGQAVYAPTNSAPTLGTGTATAGATISSGTTDGTTAVLTVTTVTHGVISPGDHVTGTGITAGTTVLNQLTGTPGGAGTYTLSTISTAETNEAMVFTSPKLLVTAIADGAFTAGDVLSGTGVPAGTAILSQEAPFSGVASILTGALSTLVVTSVQPNTDLLRVGVALPAIPGLGIAAGTTISAQVSGTPGGVGSYTLSAAGTIGAGVPVTTDDSLGGTGLYTLSTGPIAAGTASAPTTITATGTAQATGFRVRGNFSPPAAGPNVGGQLAKISSN
jgi:hypothetical protein